MKNVQCNTVQTSVELVRAFRSQMLYPVELRAQKCHFTYEKRAILSVNWLVLPQQNSVAKSVA